MSTMTTVRRRMGFLLGAAMLVASLAKGAHAQDKPTPHQNCGPNMETRLESKTCPSGVVRQRACCTRTNHKGTKTRCKSFAHCPHRSRS